MTSIPLTEEILKANEDEFKNCFCVDMTHTNGSNGFMLYIDSDAELTIHVVYVHELQHALRLCGLNELADNFKLKEE